MNPIARKSISNLVIHARFGQTHAEWQAFQKPENKRQMYDSKAWLDSLPYTCLLFV